MFVCSYVSTSAEAAPPPRNLTLIATETTERARAYRTSLRLGREETTLRFYRCPPTKKWNVGFAVRRSGLSKEVQKRRRRTLSSSIVPSHQSVQFVSGAHWGACDELGLAWEWVEDNLRMRAALVVAKMVEKGRVVELDGTLGVLWCDGKAWEGRGDRGWGFWTGWDERFWNPSRFCDFLHVFCTAML